MEVHSATRPARKGVTLAATSSLLVFAVLLSLHAVSRKNHRWSSLLAEPLIIGGQVRIMVPSGWRSVQTRIPESQALEGGLAGKAGSFRLEILRPHGAQAPPAAVLGYASNFEDIEDRQAELELEPVVCRFGRTPVRMYGVEWIDKTGQLSTLRFLAVTISNERKVLLSLRATGGSDETVKGVLRQIVASAEFITPAREGKES